MKTKVKRVVVTWTAPVVAAAFLTLGTPAAAQPVPRTPAITPHKPDRQPGVPNGRVAPQGFSVVLVLGNMQGTSAQDNVPAAARKALADMKDFLPYKGYRLLDAQWTLCCGRSAIISRLRGPDDRDYDLELTPSPAGGSGKWNVRFLLREPAEVAGRRGPNEARGAELAARKAESERRTAAPRDRAREGSDPQTEAEKALDQQRRELDVFRKMEDAKRRTQSGGFERTGSHAIIDTSFTMNVGETVVVGTSRLNGDKALIALLTAVAPTRLPR